MLFSRALSLLAPESEEISAEWGVINITTELLEN